MKDLLLSLGVALFTSVSLMASVAAADPVGGGDKHHCVMASEDTWKGLGVTDEQMKRVRSIQAACQRDHEAAKAAGGDSEAAVKPHAEALQQVLTEDQYTAWKNWCGQKYGTKAVTPKS